MTLSLALLTSCGNSSPEGEDQITPVTRSSIDLILNNPRNTRIKSLPLDRESKRAFALERAADLVIEFTGEGRFDIGVGRIKSADGNSYRDPHYFSLGELVEFFDDQRHKDLIVVNFHKAAWIRDSLESDIARINDYFRDRGYRRVVICQFTSSSRPIHSDTKFRQ
ncbi:hypothetical protein OKA05_18565 [Luteolibacter arcticus]|uniref:Uncharacterized protein n=2 Tax=Luteolibacter arcticus TaxID=1581411 RepID=A0ABT3GM21_9BACT|nr:hypothetical protein [Luteolibacter arcticus]